MKKYILFKYMHNSFVLIFFHKFPSKLPLLGFYKRTNASLLKHDNFNFHQPAQEGISYLFDLLII